MSYSIQSHPASTQQHTTDQQHEKVNSEMASIITIQLK